MFFNTSLDHVCSFIVVANILLIHLESTIAVLYDGLCGEVQDAHKNISDSAPRMYNGLVFPFY